MNIMAERMKFSSSVAIVEPSAVPVPPRMLTPPTTDAVITESSRAGGGVACMILNCVEYITLATPTKMPFTMNTVINRRFCDRPESRAASALPPKA